jgi:hypothetical protein
MKKNHFTVKSQLGLAVLCLLASAMLPSPTRSQGVPVFEITPVESSVKFDVEASVAIKGIFDKWDATLTFTSPEVSAGVLDIKIQAGSVDTGSGMTKRLVRARQALISSSTVTPKISGHPKENSNESRFCNHEQERNSDQKPDIHWRIVAC